MDRFLFSKLYYAKHYQCWPKRESQWKYCKKYLSENITLFKVSARQRRHSFVWILLTCNFSVINCYHLTENCRNACIKLWPTFLVSKMNLLKVLKLAVSKESIFFQTDRELVDLWLPITRSYLKNNRFDVKNIKLI